MFSDRLTSDEARRTERALARLAEVSWAQPVIARLDRAGGMKSENMPLMFEVRFADELHRAGVSATYEYRAGVGDSTVEFRLNTTPPWLIELVSIRASDAAKRAMRQFGVFYEQHFRPTPEDPGQSEEGEMITAEQKIGEKVFGRSGATKFPEPDGRAFHLILSDMRGYLDHGGDNFDYRQMAYGPYGIANEYSWVIHYWKDAAGKLVPIRGLFESENPLRAARFVQERIHLLGFVTEKAYTDDEIRQTAYYLANWHLFRNEDEVRQAFESYPLKPTGSSA